jgi:hypothetical protein
MEGAILVGVGSPGGAVAGSAPLQIRIVVVTTFPQGYLSLRYNAKDHVPGSQPAPARPVPGGPPRSWCSAQPGLGSLSCLGEPDSRRRSGLGNRWARDSSRLADHRAL